MAKVMLKQIQEIAPDKWQQLDGIDKKYTELESKMGFPPKKRYRGIVGPDINTLVIDRIFDSMALMEELLEKANNDPEYLTLGVQLVGIVLSQRWEVYLVL
jgi:hypothetical protein